MNAIELNNNDYENHNWEKAQIPSEKEGHVLNENWDVNMRLGFIRKTYGILSIQVAATFFLCALSVYSSKFGEFQLRVPELMFIAIFGTIISSICLFCCRSLSRSVPTNYILLFTFTLCEAYLVSVVCGQTNPQFVLMAAAMTFAVVCALTLYACTTKTDFTMLGSMLFVVSCIILLFGIFTLFTHNKLIHIIYSCLSVIAFSIYLVYDTQLIVGNHENKLEIDDYILGAMMLYVDIISLFLHILKLLKQTENK